MASFFSLGGRGGGRQRDHRTEPNTNTNNNDSSNYAIQTNDQTQCQNWLRYRTEYKGFELLCEQQQQQELQRFLLQQRAAAEEPTLLDLYASAAGLGVGVGPSSDESSSRSGFSGMRSGGISCQDCGNQAKKGCVHMRCRTCCKGRGYDCDTHVKSTWIPASRRREKQQQHQHHQQQGGGSSFPRLRRENSGMEVGNFPPEVNSPALFRCVRVRSVDEGGDDEYAYQTAVNIGGHVFKGILYDQGPEPSDVAGQSSSGGGGSGSGSGGIQPLNLINSTTAAGGDAVVGGQSSSYDPSSLYHSSYMAGTQFFPHPRP